MSDLFIHPVFRDAIADIEALGVKVHPNPTIGAKPYAVIGGRSNSRWWFIPLDNGRVTASGFALFQPLLTSARLMKAMATFLSVVGLSGLWANKTIYISGESDLANYFPLSDGHYYAYFTGTDSPHRKVAVQIMDRVGNLKGFAKITRNPAVRSLLRHEAEILTQLQKLELQSAFIPKLIFSGALRGSDILVTDTLKTSSTRSKTKLSNPQKLFINELSEKSAAKKPLLARDIGAQFYARFSLVREKTDHSWQKRLDRGIKNLQTTGNVSLPASLIHGDFTPWNTFIVEGKLYVFDWEYAESNYPTSFDLIHFLLSDPSLSKKNYAEQIKNLTKNINIYLKKTNQNEALIHIIVYLITISLRYIERVAQHDIIGVAWDGFNKYADLFDTASAAFEDE